MRTRTALPLLGVVAGLGLLVGTVVLPDSLGSAGGARPAPTSAGPVVPRPSGSTSPSPDPTPGATTTPTRTPALSTNDLLGAADFAEVGLDLDRTDAGGRFELVVCERRETLDAVAESGPPVQAGWERGSVLADQQAVTARDEDEAGEVAARVVAVLEGCQNRPAGQWVYGPTHRETLGDGVTASWMSEVDADLNTAGRAPRGELLSAGIAVVRHGARVSVLYLSWCAGAGESAPCIVAPDEAYDQLVDLSRAAARRLG